MSKPALVAGFLCAMVTQSAVLVWDRGPKDPPVPSWDTTHPVRALYAQNFEQSEQILTLPYSVNTYIRSQISREFYRMR